MRIFDPKPRMWSTGYNSTPDKDSHSMKSEMAVRNEVQTALGPWIPKSSDRWSKTRSSGCCTLWSSEVIFWMNGPNQGSMDDAIWIHSDLMHQFYWSSGEHRLSDLFVDIKFWTSHLMTSCCWHHVSDITLLTSCCWHHIVWHHVVDIKPYDIVFGLHPWTVTHKLWTMRHAIENCPSGLPDCQRLTNRLLAHESHEIFHGGHPRTVWAD